MTKAERIGAFYVIPENRLHEPVVTEVHRAMAGPSCNYDVSFTLGEGVWPENGDVYDVWDLW